MSFACQDQREATQRKLVELVCDLVEVGGNMADTAHRAGGAAHWGGATHWEKPHNVNFLRRGALGRRDALGMRRGAYSLKPENV